MAVWILVIIYQGIESLSVHDGEHGAWSALIDFVDARWSGKFKGRDMPSDELERAKAFFADEDDLYVVADADVSELAARIDDCHDDGRPFGAGT